MSPSYPCLAYHAVGAPVLLLLHGFLGNTDAWQALIALLEDSYHLIAVDLPGHGSSRWGEEDVQGGECFCHRLEQTVQAIKRLEGVNLSCFNLLGYSLGRRLAMAYTIAYPNRIKRLILEGAHPGLESKQERDERHESEFKWAKRFRQEPVADVLLDWYQQSVFSDLDDNQIRSLIHERSKGSVAFLAETLMSFSLSKQPDYRRALSALRADSLLSPPIHYFYGENDHKCGQIGQRLLAGHVIHSVHPVDGCGHNVHREEPEAMARLFRELSGV